MSENESTQRPYTHYNPVRVNNRDTVGTIFLGIIALVLLILYVRVQRRNAELERAVGAQKSITPEA
jgi:hypothetical protein